MILQSKHFDFSLLRNFLYLLTLSLRPPNLLLIIGLQFLLYGQHHFMEEGNFFNAFKSTGSHVPSETARTSSEEFGPS